MAECGILKYKDQNGNWVNVPTLKGEKGDPGTNGTNGRDGVDGTNGRDGVDGRSITITENHQDSNGNTIITFSDGTVTQVNRGEKGEKGDDGINGVNGRDGIDGVNGINGRDGQDGRDGRDGKDLTIKKTFPSVEAMNADTSLAEGDLVIISSNVDDEDNAKLYVKTANGYNYLTDLSGAKGIQGEAGRDGRDGTDGNSITMTNNEILDNGNTKVTLSDGNSFIVQKGQDGRDGRDGTNGVNGQDGHSPAITIDPNTGHWKVDGVDTGVNGKSPELPYKTIVGPGRPDQPNTTGGKINGSEVTGDEYVSTDGAGVGAILWKKVNGKWEVIQGDTGWRKITTNAIEKGYVMVRRTAENCYVSAGGGTWGTFKLSPNANVESVQMGVSGQNRNRIILTKMPQGWETPFTVSGQKVTHDGYDEVGNAVISKSDDQNAIQIRNYTGDKSQNQVLRFPMLSYPTSKAWPNTLPGEATDL